MVHLEEKYKYIEGLNQSPIISSIIDEILYDRTGEIEPDITEANQVALNLIRCVRTDDKALAEQIFNRFSKRNPTRDSHWIHDEFVVFATVCCVRKFKLEPGWINNVINLTSYPSGSIQRQIFETFNNILAGNLNVKRDFHQISLVYQHIAQDHQHDDERINKMFRSLWKISFPFYESVFLNILSLKAIQLAFEAKGLLSPQEYFESNEFAKRFFSRTKMLGLILAWLVIIALVVFGYWALWKLNFINPTLFSFITAATGIGIAGFTGLRKLLQDFFTRQLQKILGYRIINIEKEST